jgi:hypothetical protein
VTIVATLLVLSWAVGSACAPTSKVFPPNVMEGIDRNFDFPRWRMMTDGSESKKVQLGGRIVQAKADGVMVVGTTRPWKLVTVNDLSRNYPIVAA